MRFTDVVSACIAFQNDNKSHELKKLFESIQIKNADEYIEVILYFFEKKLLTPDSLDSLLQSKVPRQISQGYQYLLEEGINPDLDWLLDSKHPYKKAYFVSLLCQVDLKIFITQLDEIELNKIKGVVGDYQSLLELLQQLQCASIENIKKVLTHPNPIFLTQVMQKKFKDDRLTIDDFNFLINAKLTELEAYNILYQAKIEWLLYQSFLKSEFQEHELNVADRAKALIILHAEGLATSTNLNLVQTYLLSAQRNQIVEENMHQMIAKTLVYLHRYPQLKPYYSYIFDTYPADVLCEHLLDLIEQDFWVEQEELPEFFNTWRINNIKTLEPYKYSQKYIKESVHAYHLLMRNKNIITENPLNLFAVKRPYELVEACIELGLNLTPNRIKLMQGCIFPLYWAKILNLYLKNNSLVNNELELSLSKNKHLDRVYEFLMILDRHQSFWVYKTAYFHNFDDIYLGCKILDSAGLSIKNFISKARDKLFELQTRVLCIKKMEEKKYLTENLVNLILNEQSPNIASLLLSILQIVPENITFILSEEFIRVLRNTQAKNYTSLIKVLEWLAVMNTVPSEFFEYIIKNPNLEVVKTACKLPHEQLIKFCADLQSNKEDALERAGINYLTFKYCERQVPVSHRIFKTFFKGINYLEKNHRLDFLSISLLSRIPKEHLSIAEFILLRPELRSYQNELIDLSSRPDLQTLLFSAKELHRNNIFDEEIFLKLIEKDSDYPSLVNLVIYLVQCGYYDTYKKYVLAHGAPREFVNILYKLPKLPSTIFKSLVSDEHYYQAISDLTTHFNFRMAYQIIDILYMLQGVGAPQMYVQIFKTLGVENFIFWEKLSASAAAIQLIFRMSQNGLIVDTDFVNFLLAATEPVREHLTATYIAIEQQNIQLTDEQLRMLFYSSKPEFFLKVCHLPTIINNPAYYNFALNYLAEDFILSLQRPELTIPALLGLTNAFPQDIGREDFFQPALDMLLILKNQPPTLEETILLTANENFAAMSSMYSLLNRYCAPELITPWLIAEILTKAQNDAYLITTDAETNFWQKVSDLKSEEFIFRFVELLNYRTNISEFENPAISQAHLNTLSGYSGSFFRPLEVEEERPVKRAKLDNK